NLTHELRGCLAPVARPEQDPEPPVPGDFDRAVTQLGQPRLRGPRRSLGGAARSGAARGGRAGGQRDPVQRERLRRAPPPPARGAPPTTGHPAGSPRRGHPRTPAAPPRRSRPTPPRLVWPAPRPPTRGAPPPAA